MLPPPDPNQHDVAFVSGEWAEANDRLYYANGIADTALYNGSLTDATLVSIDPASAEITNESVWSPFVAPEPAHIVYFSNPLPFAFTPYFNLDDPTLNLDPGYLAALEQFKSIVFGSFAYGHAFLVLQGLAEPLVRFDVLADEVPSVFINFEIPRRNVKALEAVLDLPDGFKLARSKVVPNQPARYLLTLNVYQSPDALTGLPSLRAEWSVYARDRNDPTADGHYFVVIDVSSSTPSLDPFNLFTPPSPFEYVNDGGVLDADIQYPDGTDKFAFTFAMPSDDAPSVRLHREWILANDRIYWRNGVHDLLLYNGSLLDADVTEVDPNSVTIDDQTPWLQYVDPKPSKVLVFRGPIQFVLRPWFNIEEMCVP
jgi:hypothetical protein